MIALLWLSVCFYLHYSLIAQAWADDVRVSHCKWVCLDGEGRHPCVSETFCNVMMVLLPRMNGRRLQLHFHPQIDVLKSPSNTEQETSVSECREVCGCFSLLFLHHFCSMKKRDSVWGWRLAIWSFFFQKHHIYLFLKEEETWKETFFKRAEWRTDITKTPRWKVCDFMNCTDRKQCFKLLFSLYNSCGFAPVIRSYLIFMWPCNEKILGCFLHFLGSFLPFENMAYIF